MAGPAPSAVCRPVGPAPVAAGDRRQARPAEGHWRAGRASAQPAEGHWRVGPARVGVYRLAGPAPAWAGNRRAARPAAGPGPAVAAPAQAAGPATTGTTGTGGTPSPAPPGATIVHSPRTVVGVTPRISTQCWPTRSPEMIVSHPQPPQLPPSKRNWQPEMLAKPTNEKWASVASVRDGSCKSTGAPTGIAATIQVQIVLHEARRRCRPRPNPGPSQGVDTVREPGVRLPVGGAARPWRVVELAFDGRPELRGREAEDSIRRLDCAAGPVAIRTSGAVLSMIHVRETVVSLPATSRALIQIVCLPSPLATSIGDAHAEEPSKSTRQRTCAGSFTEYEK